MDPTFDHPVHRIGTATAYADYLNRCCLLRHFFLDNLPVHFDHDFPLISEKMLRMAALTPPPETGPNSSSKHWIPNRAAPAAAANPGRSVSIPCPPSIFGSARRT